MREAGDEEKQREEPEDQHPEQGLIPGGSKDGLSQEMATEEVEDEGRIEEGEEGREPVRLPTPIRVSKAEREEHELTHTPFRAWCEHCVRCRARNAPHKRLDTEEKKS